MPARFHSLLWPRANPPDRSRPACHRAPEARVDLTTLKVGGEKTRHKGVAGA